MKIQAGISWGIGAVRRKLFTPRSRSPRRRVVHTSIAGSELLVLQNEDIGSTIVASGQFEQSESRVLMGLIRQEDICVDVGANVGYYTMLMARLAMNGEVHAFEPLPLYWHLIKCSTILNGYRNVLANNVALSANPGVSYFSEAVDGAYSSLVSTSRKAEARQIQVKVDSLDNYLEQRRIRKIDVLKIDVEGAEALVLRGATKTLGSALARPRVILLELFEMNLKPYGTSAFAVLEALGKMGYQPYRATRMGELAQLKRGDVERTYNVFFLNPQSPM